MCGKKDLTKTVRLAIHRICTDIVELASIGWSLLVEKKIIILRAGGQMYGYIYDYQNFLGLNFTCSTKIHELHYNMSLDCLLERVIITFTSNVQREFVPRVPLLVAYCSLFLLINKNFFIRIV